ncbi:uncharacterized protein [Diadema setosum]|uniref:uncharacterized protein n=1 Tax=Diadema setosum TaxID=31175 RepID=UPI003B39FBE8
MEKGCERVTYRCRLCRQHLFDSTCVLNPGTGYHHHPHHHHQHHQEVPGPSTARESDLHQVPLHEGHQGEDSKPTTCGGSDNVSRSVGVLAPYGQVTVGPNPLWFINEDSTPPWVHRTLDKFQWKRGKLLCPKCNGRVGSFDFVTPYKLHCATEKPSRIHIMRNRVDCESSSPIIARIRPMPQNPPSSSSGNSLSEEGDSSTATWTSTVHRPVAGGAEYDTPTFAEVDSSILMTAASIMPSTSESPPCNFLPDAFSSASDEEASPGQPLRNDHQRVGPRSLPLDSLTRSENPLSRSPSMILHVGHPFHSQRAENLLPKGTSPSSRNNSFMAEGSEIRQRKGRLKVPVDRPVSFGLESGRGKLENDMLLNGLTVERNIAYVSGTNRGRVIASRSQESPVTMLPGMSSDACVRESQRRSQHQVWPYSSRTVDSEDGGLGDRRGYHVNRSAGSNTSTATSIPISFPADISANVFKNSQGFFSQAADRGRTMERPRNPGSSGSQSPGPYSQVSTSEQMESLGSSAGRDRHVPSLTHAQQQVRESEDEEDPALGDDVVDQGENVQSSTGERSPRKQRKERNRKKKERRKQRRYERWLERQTLGAEEESAIQDISAAGLYSLLGPRCAGSSLREVTTCSVCLDIYYQPHTCFPCEHIFCEPCLRQVARFHPVVTPCPLCRTTIRSVKLHDQLTSAVKQLFPRQFENRHQMERRTLNRSFPLPGNPNLPPWYRMGYQNNRNQVDFLASRRNAGYVHDWGMRYLQGVVWRVVASTLVLIVVSGISVGFLHFMFDFS